MNDSHNRHHPWHSGRRPVWLLVAALWLLLTPSMAYAAGAVATPQPRMAAASANLDDATATPTATSTELAGLMLQLEAAVAAQDWVLALSLADQIIAIDAEYDSIQSRKYEILVSYGYQLMTDGDCASALTQFQQALALDPSRTEASVGMELLSRYCPTAIPGTATATPTGTLTGTKTATPTGTLTVTPTGTQYSTGVTTHLVQAGETLYSLAKLYGTTVQAIMQANGMMSYYLRAGDTIYIPTGDVVLPGPTVHIVQPGETLFSIARQYGTTVSAIMSLNHLSSYLIYAYQALYISSASQAGPIVHIVQAGETLYTIALRYGTSVAALMSTNGLTSYAIRVGQQLIVPSTWSGYYPTTTPYQQYTVVPGDTLYGIALRYGTTVAAIMEANDLSSSYIYVGMTLSIP
jgi:LysM repeat protein